MDERSNVARSGDSRFADAPAVMPPSYAPDARRHGSHRAPKHSDSDVHEVEIEEVEPEEETSLSQHAAWEESHKPEHHTDAVSRHSKPTPLIDGTAARHSFLSTILQSLTILAVAWLVVVIAKSFFIQTFYIPSGSMEQTLLIGDKIMVNKLADTADEIQRGDIVVFDDPGGWLNGVAQDEAQAHPVIVKIGKILGLLPENSGEQLVKRVIGVGGDHIVCCTDTGQISVNDVPIDEPYVYPGSNPSDIEFDVTVPEGYLWVMGDNRANSKDSRVIQAQGIGSGFVPVSNVEGRAWLRIGPFSRFGLLDDASSYFSDVPAETISNKPTK